MTDIQLTGFEMMSKLGEGGMAAVWKARQVSLDRIVAIKILSSRFASDAGDIQRFQQEAQSAAKLKHPGIVQVYDANIENGLYFFVMEFVDGYTCADWLIRKGVLSETDVLLIAECVSDALGYAWDRQSMIHCDIKPDNVMIDEDGTVKVTDLGLSRTISSMNVDKESDEILGTPAYMAPEQAMGEAGQDCRLDMYALGAMMYHLSTGKLLFENCPEGEVMERQVNDTVENPKDLNPSLSLGFCQLIEVLMAKEKTGRPSSWDEVRDAIKRLKRGHSPKLHLPEGAISTVRKSVVAEAAAAQRSRITAQASAVSAAGERKRSVVLPIAIVAVVVVAAAIALKLFLGQAKPSPQPGGQNTVGTGGSEVNVIDQQARSLYYSASNWEKTHSADIDGAMRRYQQVMSECPGTKYAERAKKDIARLQDAMKTKGIEDALRGLGRQATSFQRTHQYDLAIKVYSDYVGPYADETRAQREAKVSELRSQKAAWERSEAERLAREASERYERLLDDVVVLLTRSDFLGAGKNIDDAIGKKQVPESNQDELRELLSICEEAAGMDGRVLASFADQKNQTVEVQLLRGAQRLRIQSVNKDTVTAVHTRTLGAATVSQEVEFKVSDLSMAERLRRMGMDSDPPVALVKGVMAYQSRAFEHAKRYFEMTHYLIVPRLLALLDEAASGGSDEEVQEALSVIMKQAGAEVGSTFSALNWTAAVEKLSLTPEAAAQIRAKAAKFEQDYGKSDFFEKARPVVSALNKLEGQVEQAPEVAPPHEEVNFVPPDIRLPPDIAAIVGKPAACVERLLRDNPEMGSEDIELEYDDNDRAVAISIESTALSSIAGIAGLRDLRSVEFQGGRHNEEICQLADIGPLAGLPLRRVVISRTKVDDLTPLKGLPLRMVHVTRSPLRDLSPLRGMRLEDVDLSGTKVFDFSALSMMPLKHFVARNTMVKSVSFMRGMKLETLDISDTGVFDFSVFMNMPLKELKANRTQLRRLEIFKDCPLEVLEAEGSKIMDLTPLKAMAGTLEQLALDGVPARNFDVLKELDLKRFSAADTAFHDATLITHMKLGSLDLRGTKVSDLSGLDASEMRYLNICNTDVSSIAFLKDSPIERLYCQGSKVRNFMPIYDSNVKVLYVDNPGSKWSLYSKLPELRTVNGQYIHGDPQF